MEKYYIQIYRILLFNPMLKLRNIIKYSPYSLEKSQKNKLFKNFFTELTFYHYKKCKDYKKIIKNLKFKIKNRKNELKDFPMLPVTIFKTSKLISVNKKKIVKKLVSSGTTGQNLSEIYLDKKNANDQMMILSKIIEKILGKKRLPMLIIDQNPKLNNNRSIYNARTAAILGFSLFGRDYCYLLNEKNEIDYQALNNFIKKYENEKFFIFGFTSLIYECLIKKLSTRLLISNFKNGILLHGGGWKKLEKIKINNKLFKKKISKKLKLNNIYNYYGLVEQAGSIFIESKKCGYFHTSIYSDILIRDHNFKVLEKNKRGLIQLFSLLPSSYPGHNILTEDIGELKGEDDCRCGLKGKYFLVYGRSKKSELRGCSDVR